MVELATKTMTVREIATYCGCSKIPVNKQIERLQLANTTVMQNGKRVTAYNLTKLQLDNIKNTIQANKGEQPIDNTIIDNTPIVEVTPKHPVNTAYSDLLDKYLEVKSLYDIASTTQKLLEDRQGEHLTKLNELQQEKETLITEKATLQADLRHSEEQLESVKKESSKQVNLYKYITVGACVVSVILLLMLLATFISR